ncbi:MAG: lipocalin-like domain-containing protein [Acidobacteriota bacterium]
MKTSVKIVFCTLFIAMLMAVSCTSTQSDETAAEPEATAAAGELVGVWKIMEATIGPETEEPVFVENHRPGIFIFTSKYFSWVDVHGEEPAPELPEEPTDAQLAQAYAQLTAITGSYELNGSKVSSSIIVSKNPNDMGAGENVGFEYSFEGDMLVLKVMDNTQAVLIFKLKRLE